MQEMLMGDDQPHLYHCEVGNSSIKINSDGIRHLNKKIFHAYINVKTDNAL